MARIDRSLAVTIALALLAAGTAVAALFALPASELPLTYRAESGWRRSSAQRRAGC